MDDRLYRRWRKEFLLGRPWCEAGDRIRLVDPAHECGNRGWPGGRATEVHHRRRRGRGGHLTSPLNALPVCADSHDWIHAHPKAAHELGLLLREGDAEWARCAAEPELEVLEGEAGETSPWLPLTVTGWAALQVDSWPDLLAAAGVRDLAICAAAGAVLSVWWWARGVAADEEGRCG